MSKIQKGHLERAAYIYIRQSTLSQVQHNLESQRRQYALVERAQELGWQEIRVVDEDMGRSGSGHVEREGFEALLAEVCQGQVGGVFAVEASRLARNGHEWHRLLEFCGVVDTLIIDHDGIYNPKHPNDRLVLGLKGRASRVSMGEHDSRQHQERLVRHLPCGSPQVCPAISGRVRVPVQSSLQTSSRDWSTWRWSRAGAATQVTLGLSGNQDTLWLSAQELGWQEIRVVDEDMGRSGSGHVEREGFEALLAEVCQGQVGGVFAVEASRLARNGHEWHRLLEFCGVVDTLIIDHDGIYNPKHPNAG